MRAAAAGNRRRRRRPSSSAILLLSLGAASCCSCGTLAVAHIPDLQTASPLSRRGLVGASEEHVVDPDDYEDVQDYVAAGGVAHDEDTATQEGDEATPQEKTENAVPDETSSLSQEGVEEEEEVASDSVEVEAAQELLKEAESDMSVLMGGEEAESEPQPAPANLSSSTSYEPESHRSAWVAHGTVGAIVFGLLVPSAISSALFRDLFPAYWIYIHVTINVMTFALTFFAVGIAVATMNGMGDAREAHMKEVHHIVGLLLLMTVSFQTANGFLRPPREFVTDDEHDRTPGAVLRSTLEDKSMTARTLWHLVHFCTGLFIFGLGAYQVRSGLGLYARRFGTPDWGQAYVGYIVWLAAVILVAKVWLMWKGRRAKKTDSMEIQMGRGSNLYDPENNLTEARFETV